MVADRGEVAFELEGSVFNKLVQFLEMGNSCLGNESKDRDMSKSYTLNTGLTC